jgi:hypothetical protein
VASPQGGAARGGPAPPSGVALLLLLSLPPSGYFRLLVIYEFLGIFSKIVDLQKYGVLTVLFLAES